MVSEFLLSHSILGAVEQIIISSSFSVFQVGIVIPTALYESDRGINEP